MRIFVLLLLVWPQVSFAAQGNRSELYLKAADRLLANGYTVRALQYLERAIQLDPTSTKGYLKRGFVYLQQEKRDLALADFSRAIEIAPRDGSGYVTRGMVYNQGGDKEHAVADFRKGCELSDADACTMLKELEEAR